ncbi:unnamed protein product [Prunus armeniaca]
MLIRAFEGLSMRKKVILQPHHSISAYGLVHGGFELARRVAWVKLMTLCIAGLQQNGATTSIRDCLCVNKGLPLPLVLMWDRASVYVQKLRMLTDFEGVTRKNEVGFCVWTSKEVVGRKLPTASIEHPKIYRMKLWATNEVRTKSKFWYFLRKLKKVKKSNGQVLAINESMLFCGGEVVPPQLSSWLNPICCQRKCILCHSSGQVLLASLDAIKLKPLQRTRKNRSHLYSKAIKRKIPFQHTSRQKIPFHHPVAYIWEMLSNNLAKFVVIQYNQIHCHFSINDDS